MKYAKIEQDTNKLLGFYLMQNKEKTLLEIPDDIWQLALKLNANCYENGKFIVKDFRTDTEIRTSEINTQISEAKAYLASTDFYMTVDKYAELDEARKIELTTKRAKARELINTLEAELGDM